MSTREEIAQLALALPPDDRAYVAEVLELSLIPAEESENHSEFLAELERRSAAYRAGTMTARPGLEFIEELKARRAGGFQN